MVMARRKRRGAGVSSRMLPVALGLLADRAFGEPSVTPHPVAVFGRCMRAVERAGYRDSLAAGVRHAAIGVGLGGATGVLAALAGAAGGGGFGTAAASATATYLAVAGRALGEAAGEVGAALVGGDVELARRHLPVLVGRNPDGLDEKEIARAAVESVAENTVDAIVAPVLWAALAGAPGALAYRAVNTLDAMVGHRSTRYRHYGWASARLDDLAGWFPARVTAALVIAVRPGRAGEVLRCVRRDAHHHPSPNAGVAEAAFAAALGLRLGGVNSYGDPPVPELRPTLGEGRAPEAADIARAVKLSGDVALALAGALVMGAVVAAGARAATGRRSRNGSTS